MLLALSERELADGGHIFTLDARGSTQHRHVRSGDGADAVGGTGNPWNG